MSEQPFPGESADRSSDDTVAASPADPATSGTPGGTESGGESGTESDTESVGAGPVGSGGITSTGTGGAGWRSRGGALELEPCQFPGGCANSMEYVGSGRRPKYCYQAVGGVMHDRVNAKRIADGGTPARRRGEPDDALARPIARAGQTVTDQVAALISRLEEGGTELRDALGTLADPEAVAAEIAAARRAARAEVDQAQAATDEARAQARAARDTAEVARRSAAVSDDEAADATAARDAAELARAEAVTAREAAQAQLAATRAELEQQIADLTAERDAARVETERVTTELTAQLAEVRAELDTALVERNAAAAERDTITADLTTELTMTRRDLDRAETDRARLTDELHETREQAAEYRAARAAAESSLTALRTQLVHDVDRERAYGEQRLTDAETRHGAQVADLRTELARARRRTTGPPAENDHDPTDNEIDHDTDRDNNGVAVEPAAESSHQSSRPAGARRARSRAAQRRPGPTATDPPDQPDQTGQTGDTDHQE
ncbi:hypothetical protein [Pseudonocardia sp. ICBG162]|uniref:hypothetical protein n=1 Tax=Pseudonocardia sp. ICBG162 TaxID=2846761 RepID=UPI001CF683A2|nr:hypothetical protein [Pseudonocardia sp. ICBG162]